MFMRLSVALRKESVDRNTMCWPDVMKASQSLSARRAWIEMRYLVPLTCPNTKSLSARRAWIEIPLSPRSLQRSLVALRKESVDRNPINVMSVSAVQVALRKESVDRNIRTARESSDNKVALRKESVDRNWKSYLTPQRWLVALRKESVDRNFSSFESCTEPLGSLSARRAWIEMSRQAVPHLPMAVALRKESVDRNPTDVVSV